MKYAMAGLVLLAMLAAACPYDVTSGEPSALTGLLRLLFGFG
jgi:hypothetical protein